MKKQILIGIAAVLLLVLIFGLLQALLLPKYTTTDPVGRIIGEYYANSGDNDVIFVGDCEVYESFVPSVMWEEYGITSYIRGSGQQLAWQSYYLLEEMLEYENPKVVVFNVLALKYGTPTSESSAFNRMTLDGMKWSSSKWNAINASITEEENILEYILPILRYHSRITELEKDDFKYWLKAPQPISDNGYLMQTHIDPMPEHYGEMKGDTLDDYKLPDTSMEYLEKMRLLCEEKGCELILIKAPTNSWRYWWYDEWEEQIVSYAESKGVTYYNFIDECEAIGIDWSTDTYDKGVHLNVYGAEKMSRYFGKILIENHGVADRRKDTALAEEWNKRLDVYKNRKKGMEET